jgi:PAS domain S-box-containing protein
VIHAFVLNVAVNLLVGASLLVAWRCDPAQRFSRTVGIVFLVQAGSPLAFMVSRAGGAWHPVGQLVMLAIGISGLTLLLTGVAQLSGRSPSRRALGLTVLAMLLLTGPALAFNGRLAQALGASLHVLVGVLALLWLWGHGRVDRLTGALLVLVGVNQFSWVVFGDAAIPWQASIGTTLRLMLGLTLLHAAITRSATEARRVRDRFMQMAERSHQGMAVIVGETVAYANPALRRIYGMAPEGAIEFADGVTWRDATMPEAERAAAREQHRRLVGGEVAHEHWQGERRAFDGRTLHLRFSAWRVDWDGVPAEQVVITDDTAHHDAMQTLLHQATHDTLTGLPNRSALLQRLRELCSGTAPFALLLLDIDRFKLFNEAHGPSIGDEVLRALAGRLAGELAGRAELMRLGEDEFALLATAPPDKAPSTLAANDTATVIDSATDALDAADAEQRARALAHDVRQMLQQPIALSRHRFFLDVSIGVALHPASAREPEALLRSANAAMHEAKRTPGTSLQFAEERFERGSGATLEAEQALRAGIEDAEFNLVYQPKVDARSGALVGFEALVRWDRPGLGRISPLEFIPAAERTGLIRPLGSLILTLACRQIAEWQRSFERAVPVAVNVSPLQLLDPGFVELVLATLHQFGVAARLLSLEITESAAVTHMEQARERIGELRSHGIEVALDDFGTGFSSLNMLRSLPLTSIKIDRSLIDPMPAPDATAVVKAICDLAGALRLEVVAEGVESAAHAKAALAAGCGVLQGYLYARPLDAHEAGAWMRERRAVVQHAA